MKRFDKREIHEARENTKSTKTTKHEKHENISSVKTREKAMKKNSHDRENGMKNVNWIFHFLRSILQ